MTRRSPGGSSSEAETSWLRNPCYVHMCSLTHNSCHVSCQHVHTRPNMMTVSAAMHTCRTPGRMSNQLLRRKSVRSRAVKMSYARPNTGMPAASAAACTATRTAHELSCIEEITLSQDSLLTVHVRRPEGTCEVWRAPELQSLKPL